MSPGSGVKGVKPHAWVLLWMLPVVQGVVWGPSPQTIQQLIALGCAALLAMYAISVPINARLLLFCGVWLGLVGLQPDSELQPSLGLAAGLLTFLLSAQAGSAASLSRRLLVLALAGLATGALVNAVIGILQFLGMMPVGVWGLFAGQAGEAMGNLRQRNQLATYSCCGLVLLWLWMSERSTVKANQRRWPLLAAALLCIANAMTSSRTGFISLCVLAGLCCWRMSASRTYWTCALGLYAVTSAGMGIWGGRANVLTRLGGEVSDCSSRRVLWANVIELTEQQPWFGWGWGELDWAHFIHDYKGERFCEILDNAHNLLLHWGVELGLIGAALLSVCTLLVVRFVATQARSRPGRPMLWLCLIPVIIHSMLEYPLWFGPFQMLAGFCLGFYGAGRAEYPGESKVNALVATLSLVGVLWAVIDYVRVAQAFLPVQARWVGWSAPMQEAKPAWLYRETADFARVTTMTVTAANAEVLKNEAEKLLHYSPEPAVLRQLMRAYAQDGGWTPEALQIAERFRAVYPESYQAFMNEQGVLPKSATSR